jgi:hypothetical protein
MRIAIRIHLCCIERQCVFEVSNVIVFVPELGIALLNDLYRLSIHIHSMLESYTHTVDKL